MLIGSLKVTSMDETDVFRGLGETAAIEVRVSGLTTVVVAWADRGRLDVAGVVGRDAVEAVGVAVLTEVGSGGQRRVGQPGGVWPAVVRDVDRVRAMAEPLAESVPDQETLNSGDGSSGGRAATVLVRPVPASIVLKIWGVLSGGWVSKIDRGLGVDDGAGRVGLACQDRV